MRPTENGEANATKGRTKRDQLSCSYMGKDRNERESKDEKGAKALSYS